MRFRGLSGRLTVAAAAAVVVAVLVLGIGARLIVDHQMRSSLDDSLRQRASDVARLSVSAPAVLTQPGALEAPVAGRQLTVEVVDRQGAIVARSLALGAKLLPNGPAVAAALQGRSGFSDFTLGGAPSRMFVAPIAEAGGPAAGGAVMVAASTDDIERTMHRLTFLLLLCGLLAIAVGAGAAAILTRRGLRPVRQLSSSAVAIEDTGDASRRLPEPPTADEVGELARTLNRMLAALEAARTRERRFLADASHELRTPLTALTGNVDFLGRHGANPEVVSDLEQGAERIRGLLDDLLALEREDGAERPKEPVRLDRIVAEAAVGRSSAQVTANAPVTVLGEPQALRRALENLIDNAEVHGPSGGTVSIALAAGNGQAELSVTDEGSGLSPVEAEHAFDRFWRGHDALHRPGSGLGLAIVMATAERHGGTARAEGSTITIAIPVSPDGDKLAPETSPAPTARASGR